MKWVRRSARRPLTSYSLYFRRLGQNCTSYQLLGPPQGEWRKRTPSRRRTVCVISSVHVRLTYNYSNRSSTLENWLREFKRFAPNIVVRAYYADKNNRSALRQELHDTQRRRDDDGWEVLVTTYNLAQGDEKDRKFFRKMEWEVCRTAFSVN